MVNKIIMVLVILMAGAVSFWGVQRMQILNAQKQVQVLAESKKKAALESSEMMHRKINALTKFDAALFKQEEPLRQQLKAAAGTPEAQKIRERLFAMLKDHYEAIEKERAKLGLPPLTIDRKSRHHRRKITLQ